MPKMPFSRILILLSFIFISLACSNKEIVEPHTLNGSITIDGELSDWPHDKALLHSSDYFDYYVTHDQHYLYIFTSFKSQFYQRAAENVGFTVYVDNDPELKRSFGITYPLGVTNAMREIPGVLEEYTDDTEWLNEPANQKLWESLQSSVYEKVMLTRRLNSRETPQRLILPLKQINAQGIKIARNKDGRKIQLEMRIPIQSSRTEQFAADPREGQPVHIGFEIQPPEFDLRDEVNENSVMSNRQRGSYYGSGQRRQPSSYDLEKAMSRRMGEYRHWVWIQL
ncbi:MAG: hypothetical protein ACQETE_04495 [Bacteroidota bacterium]